MKLFVTDTCPRCIPIKNMIKDRTDIEIINLTNNDELIEKFRVTSVPSLLTDNNYKTHDIQEIVKLIKESE